MPLYVVKRPGRAGLYLRGTVKKRRIFESAGTTDREVAEEIRAVREAELVRGAVLGVKPKVTFGDAALAYLQNPGGEPRSRTTELLVSRLTEHLGPDITCDQVDQACIDRACRMILRPGSVASSKLRLVITPAKAVLMYAARRQWCEMPRFEKIKAGGKRTDWLTPDEVDAQITAAAPHLQPLLAFLYCTGARLGEALALKWVQVDLLHGRCTLLDTKNGEDRMVDLPARALAALAVLPHRSGRVFLNDRGLPYRLTDTEKHGAMGGQIRTAWTTSLRRAGIDKPVTPHHARHTWASWHYCVHRDLLKLKEDGCWKTVSQVERYAKRVPDGLRDPIVAFWDSGCLLSAASLGNRKSVDAA